MRVLTLEEHSTVQCRIFCGSYGRQTVVAAACPRSGEREAKEKRFTHRRKPGLFKEKEVYPPPQAQIIQTNQRYANFALPDETANVHSIRTRILPFS